MGRASLAALLVAVLLLTASPLLAQPITEGVVEFEIEYEDVGAMAAFMPKTETLYFRGEQARVEMGASISLMGVEEGKRIQLMELGGRQIAFVTPQATGEQHENDVRVETADHEEKVAGLAARAFDLVDVRDPSNRLPVLVSDQIAARHRSIHPDLEGFALDYYQPIQDGLGHWRARKVEARTLEDSLFTVPDGYERVELGSIDEMATKIQELLGGQGEVQVVE